MKVAIVGSSGYIAGFLIKKFSDNPKFELVLKIDQTESADVFLDLRKPELFDFDVLKGIDFIVFTAAISGPDKCAEDYDFCWSINVTGTQYFIEEAIKKGCKVLFFSSDAVFGDIPGQIYTEYSVTNASTPYGKMKKAIEDMFWDNSGFKAIRLSYVASAKDRFVSYCLQCMEHDENAEIFHPFYRNCIVVSDVVDVVIWFAFHWDEYMPKVLNVAGTELVSRVRIADEINRLMNGKLNYIIVKPDMKFYQNRPAITQMQSSYLEQYGILKNESFTEKIKRELEKE